MTVEQKKQEHEELKLKDPNVDMGKEETSKGSMCYKKK
jgi:hypothetical protein